jgi:hypothetical protein
MVDGVERQAVIDEEHLKLLSVGYMVAAAITAVFSLIGLLYMGMGIFVSRVATRAVDTDTAEQVRRQVPPAFMGWIFGAIGLFMFLFMAGMAAAKFRTAVCLKQRKSRTFCMVVAAISCLEFPYGTVLGVLTFIALGRDSVVRMFDS